MPGVCMCWLLFHDGSPTGGNLRVLQGFNLRVRWKITMENSLTVQNQADAVFCVARCVQDLTTEPEPRQKCTALVALQITIAFFQYGFEKLIVGLGVDSILYMKILALLFHYQQIDPHFFEVLG